VRCITHLAAFAVIAVGCGSSAEKPQKRESHTWRVDSMEAVAPGDAVVAKVNGRSIFASCVRIQAEAHQLSRDRALEECIDFELLAEAAELADTNQADDVQTTAKQELVRTFIEDRYNVRGPMDIPQDLVKKLWDQVQVPRYNHPELRNIVFCRIPLTKEQGPESEEFKIGLVFLQGVYEKLRDERNIEKNDLFELCWKPHYEEAGVHKLKLNTFKIRPKSGYMEEFHKSVFGPTEVGVVAPPLYSQYGIDLILISEIIPEKSTTFEEAEPELREVLFNFPVYESTRDLMFEEWYAPFAKSRAIATFQQHIPEREALLGSATPAQSGAPK
jgi:hypothetical protein